MVLLHRHHVRQQVATTCRGAAAFRPPETRNIPFDYDRIRAYTNHMLDTKHSESDTPRLSDSVRIGEDLILLALWATTPSQDGQSRQEASSGSEPPQQESSSSEPPQTESSSGNEPPEAGWLLMADRLAAVFDPNRQEPLPVGLSEIEAYCMLKRCIEDAKTQSQIGPKLGARLLAGGLVGLDNAMAAWAKSERAVVKWGSIRAQFRRFRLGPAIGGNHLSE